MPPSETLIFSSYPIRRVAAGLMLASAALLAGCKGNTTAAAYPDRKVPHPPAVTAQPAPGQANLFAADPLTSPHWTSAPWMQLTAPANTARTTSPTRAALFFDSDRLYVAFVSDKQPGTVTRDLVSVYLDSSAAQNGTDIIRISVDGSGAAACTWIRSAIPAEPREDAGPSVAHPISAIPDVAIKGLATRVVETDDHGTPVWTAVVAVPLKFLPLPLKTTAAPGKHWKINLLRNVTSQQESGGGEQLQANLSPVYVGAQDITPYRLSPLTLVQ